MFGFPLTHASRHVTSRRVASRHVEVLKLFRGGAVQLRPGKWKNSVIDLKRFVLSKTIFGRLNLVLWSRCVDRNGINGMSALLV